MRNLKRALSLALSAAMLIGMMVIGAAASYEDFTDKDEIQNKEAVSTMVALGVLAGKEDGSYFDPTGTVTRAEMAKVVAVSLNGGKDPVMGSDSKTTFKDTQGHWAELYIAYCVQQNIIAGRGDNTFGPDLPVTGSAAAKMFLCALGYRADLEGLVGRDWEINTNVLANQEADLYEGLASINASQGLTRDNTAQMLYNAVQAQEVKYDNLFGNHSDVLQTVNQGTMLANRFGVLKVTGIAVANEKKTLDPATYNTTKDAEGRISVTAVSGYTTIPAALASNPSFKVAMSDDMLGQEIVLYVKFLNNLSPNAANSTVMGTPILTDNNVIVETNGRLKDADAVKSALRAAGIAMPTAGTAPAIQYTSGAVGSTASNGVKTTAGVSQRFIDNDGDGIVEYIIQETPALAKINAINKSGETITFSSPIGAQDNADVVGYENMAKGDYVLIVKYDNDKYYVTKAETAEGEVTAYTPGAVPSITAGGEKYVLGAGANLSDALTTFNNTLIGNTYTLFLDANGNLLGHKLVESAVANYAVVLGAGVTGNSAMGYSAKVKVLLSDGTQATYAVDLTNSAVKLGLIAASATDTAKEAAIVASGGAWFDTAVSGGQAGSSLANKLFSYTLDGDKTITLCNPNTVNSTYTTAVFTADQDLNKSKATYNITSDTVLADDNTIFFLANKNSSGVITGYSVVEGLSKLPSSNLAADDTNAGQVVYYVAPGTSTKAAKAIWVELDNDTSYSSSASYAFISDGYTETSDGGTPIYTYPVVFEDGTVGSLSSKSSNGVKNSVMKYVLDSKGYATFSTDGYTKISSRVDYLGNGTVSLANKDTNAAYISLALGSGASVWNVEDTNNIYSTEVSENDVVAIVTDSTTGAVKTVFIYDTLLGDMTSNVTSPTVVATDAAGGSKTVSVSASGALGTAAISSAEAGDVIKVTYTAATTQKVTVSIDGAGTDVAGTETTGTGAAQDSGSYTLAAGDVGSSLTITVKVTEDNKDTRTTVYTVSVAA